MQPQINDKTWLECTLDDIRSILGNSDYRENEHVDYKEAFHYFVIQNDKQVAREEARAEFRKDVCSFANADGGYLVFGIQEDGSGIPNEITGIEIKDKNTDKFEMEVRNLLQPIQPKRPVIQFHIVPVDTKYIVIIYVENDGFNPYVFNDEKNNYRIYKRYGNRNLTMSYEELRTMFNQSMIMEKEIERFRKERIDFFRYQEDNESHDYSKFCIIHIIPDTFMNPRYKKRIFVLESKGAALYNVFKSFLTSIRSVPIVDGIHYLDEYSNSECRLFNGGIAEAFVPIDKYVEDMYYFKGEKYLNWEYLWEKIYEMITVYVQKAKTIIETKRIFICISIIGCKGIATDYNREYYSNLCTIDRNNLYCDPFPIDNVQDSAELDRRIKELQFDYFMALGVRYHKSYKELYKNLYVEKRDEDLQ